MTVRSNDEGKAPIGNNLSLSELVPKGHKLYHLFNFINENYGSSPENILRAIGSIFDFDKGLRTLFNSHKKFSAKNIINLLRYTFPAALYSAEMAIKLTKYIKMVRKGELSEWEKFQVQINKLLDIRSGSIDKWSASYLNEDILEWLLKKPKTEGYKILGYHNHSTMEKMEKVPNELEESLFILFEYHKKRILLKITIKSYGSIHFLDELTFLGEYPLIDYDVTRALEMLILKDFILTFNIKENILEFRGGLITKKRAVVNENINQFDIKPLVSEIRKILKHGRKRGYAFIGKQGTGKSIIMRKIEETLTDLIVIKISPEEFTTSTSIKRCFNLIRTVQPALIIIEDLDAFSFKDKNERVGTFINEIDDSSNLNAVFLVTINDPDMIHRTIIDRPGRFDEIYEIKPPQTELEAYEVMKSKYDKLINSYTGFINVKFPKMKQFNHGILERCIKNKFTQAELTSGIIEKIFLNTNNPKEICFNEAIKKAINSFEISKKSLKTYKFNEGDNLDPADQECCEDTPMEVSRASIALKRTEKSNSG